MSPPNCLATNGEPSAMPDPRGTNGRACRLGEKACKPPADFYELIHELEEGKHVCMWDVRFFGTANRLATVDVLFVRQYLNKKCGPVDCTTLKTNATCRMRPH